MLKYMKFLVVALAVMMAGLSLSGTAEAHSRVFVGVGFGGGYYGPAYPYYPPAYYYPPPAYYYPPPPAYYYPPAYYAPGVGIGATFVFGGGGGHWHHH